MRRFGLLMVALLVVLGGALGWAIVVGPELVSSPAPGISTSPTRPAKLPAAPGTPSPVDVPEVPRVDTALSAQAPIAAEPARLIAASLGVDVPVVAVGLDATEAMALPPDPAIAGWYQFGSAPASPAGATVIAAHVDSLVYGLGPFAEFADAMPGTEIVVTDAAGLAHTYAVTSVDTTVKGDVAWANVFDRTGAPRLVVVTCGGEFDYSTRHYLSNLIVVATPVE